MKLKRLPDAELEVMKALWDRGPNTSRTEIGAILEDFCWAPNTINTYLARLVEKGFVSVCRNQKTNLYTALVSREEYLAFDSRQVISQLYGSPRNFLAALAREGLERGDLDDLRSLLEELEADSNA